ncbi:hypothetical protein NT07LI_1805 [Listeria innocua FSL S4-378]|nr:hypothetical protein NT07LI_1805 [Listeria innocua FSL S4-378]
MYFIKNKEKHSFCVLLLYFSTNVIHKNTLNHTLTLHSK